MAVVVVVGVIAVQVLAVQVLAVQVILYIFEGTCV